MFPVNLPMTYLLLRSRRKATTAYTSIAASHRLRQKIQLMHQMRATGVELFRRRPDLYPDAKCRRCGIQDEDELHIFACPRALDEVYEAVRACIESTLTFVSQILKKNKGALATLEYTVEQYTDINFWEGRQYFRVSREMGSRDSRLPSCTMLLQGLIPQRYIDDLEGTGASSASIRSHIVRQVGNLLQNIHKSVWLPRCHEQIEWEEHQGITTAQKREGRTKQSSASNLLHTHRNRRMRGLLCHVCSTRHADDTCAANFRRRQQAVRMWHNIYIGKKPARPGLMHQSHSVAPEKEPEETPTVETREDSESLQPEPQPRGTKTRCRCPRKKMTNWKVAAIPLAYSLTEEGMVDIYRGGWSDGANRVEEEAAAQADIWLQEHFLPPNG